MKIPKSDSLHQLQFAVHIIAAKFGFRSIIILYVDSKPTIDLFKELFNILHQNLTLCDTKILLMC